MNDDPERKPTRLKWYDYSTSGAYFITVTSVIGWLKYRTTKEIMQTNGNKNQKLFRRSFYDHIIRNRDDYDMITRYIHDNPMKWKCDRFHQSDE